MTENTHYEMWYRGEGVSITEYDTTGEEWTVKEEWWYTWPEVFAELTGIEGYSPSIHSEW